MHQLSEIERILEDYNDFQKGVIYKKPGDASPELDPKRRSDICWVNDDRLKSFITSLFKNANREYFGFNLGGGGVWDVQYTKYISEDLGYYDWHPDQYLHSLGNRQYQRKLSITIQLSNPEEYEGGEFLLDGADLDQDILKQKGRFIIFPSLYRHKVCPVTKGKRLSLVSWYEGPRWQ